MDKKVIAIGLVAIIIVAAVAVVAFGGSDDDSDAVTIDYEAKVYGNANTDAYVNGDDVTFLKNIIDGGAAWDKSANPYADANRDGKIDSSDVALVEKIIADEECEVWYVNGFNEAQKVSYPIRAERIALTYWQQGELISLLGHWDDVIAVNESIYKDRANQYDLSNIEYHFGTTTGSSVNEANCEMLEELGVDLILASPYASNRTPLDSYLPDVTKIYINPSGFNCITDALTLGVLMDSEDRAEAYAEYALGSLKEIQDAMATIPEEEIPSMMIVRMYADNDAYIQKYGGLLVNVADTDGVYQILSLLADCYNDNSDKSTTPNRSVEWFLEHDFDIIFDMEVYTGFKPSDTTSAEFYTQEEYNERFENSVRYFEGTKAYENGGVIGSSYIFGGYSAFASLKMAAHMIYPDKFTLEDGQESLQYWYDEFTPAEIDVTTQGGYYYTGDEYKCQYMD